MAWPDDRFRLARSLVTVLSFQDIPLRIFDVHTQGNAASLDTLAATNIL